MKTHYLKTWPEYFQHVESGNKTFEVRKNDRYFEVGDILVLEEWRPDSKEYTGKLVDRKVTYVYFGGPVAPGFVVMGMKPIQ